MDHIRAECKGNCGPYGCNVCNLFICSVCGCAEGSLTTDCPGVDVSDKDQDRIYRDGNLDYRNGAWVNEPNPTNQAFIQHRQKANS